MFYCILLIITFKDKKKINVYNCFQAEFQLSPFLYYSVSWSEESMTDLDLSPSFTVDILRKYHLYDYLDRFISTANFLSTLPCRCILNEAVNSISEVSKCTDSINADCDSRRPISARRRFLWVFRRDINCIFVWSHNTLTCRVFLAKKPSNELCFWLLSCESFSLTWGRLTRNLSDTLINFELYVMWSYHYIFCIIYR